MGWVGDVLNLREIFLLAYGVFVIWSLINWIRTLKLGAFKLRDWLGSFGLIVGVLSAAMFGWYFLAFDIEHKLIVHGSALWIYYYSGECLALLGFVLGLTSRGQLRQSAMIVSVVMVFQWYGRMVVGQVAEAILTIALLCLMIVGGTIWFAGSRIAAKLHDSSVRPK